MPISSSDPIDPEFAKAAAQSELAVLRARVAEIERAQQDGGPEDLLRQIEPQLRRVVDEMSEGLIVLGTNGEMVFQNRASALMRGVDDNDRINFKDPSLQLMAWDIDGTPLSSYNRPAARVLRGESFQNVVIRTTRPSRGDEFWGSYNGSALQDARGRLTLCFVTMRDITPQMHALDALRLSNQRLGQFFHSEMMGAIYWELGGRISDANDTFLRMLGYTRDELLAGQVNARALTPSEFREQDESALSELNTTGVGTPYEKEFIRKDGTRIPVLIGWAARSDDRREGTAFVLDITERKRAEADARRLTAIEAENRQIQEADRLKSQFLANMSHELRTPLNGIIGFSEIMEDEKAGPLNATQKEYLGDILNSGQHLLQLINDVLDLSKVESGKLDFHPKSVDLPSLLKEVSDILDTAITRKNVRPAVDSNRCRSPRPEARPGSFETGALQLSLERH